MVVNEHQGEIMYSRWNSHKKVLATGGTGDFMVNVWDLNMFNSQWSQPKPMMQLRHIALPNENAKIPDRSDPNHFISSIQWSNSGEKLLTSAHDNIARVWNMQGKLVGLFRAEGTLIFSCWNKSDSLVASGGDETNLLIWNPSSIQIV